MLKTNTQICDFTSYDDNSFSPLSVSTSDDLSPISDDMPEEEEIPFAPEVVASGLPKSLFIAQFVNDDPRIGIMTKIMDDGNSQKIERIFKIIREREIEFDSDDEDSKSAS